MFILSSIHYFFLSFCLRYTILPLYFPWCNCHQVLPITQGYFEQTFHIYKVKHCGQKQPNCPKIWVSVIGNLLSRRDYINHKKEDLYQIRFFLIYNWHYDFIGRNCWNKEKKLYL